jgi:hypothetical protein
MNKVLQLIITCTLLPLTLAACQQGAAPSDKSVATPSTAAPATQTTTSELITTVPSSLSACAPAAEVTVKWDTQAAHIANVEVWVGSEQNNAKIFAAGGAKGEAKTGPWVSPGTRFELRDKATGKALGETVVNGPSCP